ncbi:NADH kinase [Tanacetum coccineum]
MGRRRLLLLLKPLDAYSIYLSNAASPSTNPKVLSFLDNRCKVHRDAIEFCQNILRRKPVDWDATFRSNLSQPIHYVDLVVTVGGDGTLLQASHLLNDSIPLLGVNSDPTQPHEVQKFGNEFDATRSTDPCPASASRRRIRKDGQASLPLTNCRSSGLRVSTAAGSTAAMLSAGGFQMPILSTDLQYMVREPISPTSASLSLMHGLVKPNETMDIDWYTNEGLIYVDGHRNTHPVQHGDTIQSVSSCGLLAILMKRKLRDRSLPKKKLRDSIMCSLAIHRGKNGSAKQVRRNTAKIVSLDITIYPSISSHVLIPQVS